MAVKLKINKTCKICLDEKEVEVSGPAFIAWHKGELIQDAMPEISAADRELLVSGVCGTCFDKMFPPEEEGEDEQ